MITTATTRLEYPRPQDGSLRDLDPRRRAARLRDGGIRIERVRPMEHVVHLPDGSAHRRRSFTSAERVAHRFLDAR